jgi:propionyl-CoA synthetase
MIFDSPLAGIKRTFSYAELLDEVSTFAAVLQDFGTGQAIALLFTCRRFPRRQSQCSHAVVFGGLAAKELTYRIDDAKPKLVLSASCGIEPGRIVTYKNLLDEAISPGQGRVQYLAPRARQENPL